MNKVLIVNVNWIGDVIFSSPIFAAIKEAYPNARISCMAVPRVQEVCESIPAIDKFIVFDERGAHRSLISKWRLIRQLRREKFDMAVLLHRSFSRALLLWLSGIPQRVGYDTKRRGCFLSHKFEEIDVRKNHRMMYYLNVIESLGVPVAKKKSRLVLSDPEKREVDELLKKEGISSDDYLVVVNPGGNWDLKRWAPKNFTLLIEQLMENNKVKVIVSGAEKDISLVNNITKSLKRQPILMVGQTNLKHLIALMARADLVISADSGPLHIASSVGTDVLGIFGPTRPEITGPKGEGRSTILQEDVGCNRQACYFLACSDNLCMQAITVERVINAVKEIRDT